MIGMILAAGYGTRLRPLTWSVPKPMVPLCNRPLVAWAVESYLAAGVTELVVNLHHLPEAIEAGLREAYGSRATLHFSFEQEILGTGGAIRRVRDLLAGHEEFFLVNGDTVQFPRYDGLRERRRAEGADAALTLRHPPPDDRFTPVWFDEGAVTGFGEGRGVPLMFAGSHAISRSLLDVLPDEEVFGIVDRVYEPLIRGGRRVAALVDDGLWFDVGTPARYLGASAGLLDAILRGEVAPPAGSSASGTNLVGHGARVSGTAERSTVGAGSVVEGHAGSSIVWDGCRIGPRVRLERCVVASGVELDGELDLESAVVCADHPSIPADVPRHGEVVIARF